MEFEGFVLISPYARKVTPQGNPKDYPYWDSVVKYLLKKNYQVVQVGISGEKEISAYICHFLKDLKLRELKEWILDCDFWLSVDNFFPHLAHLVGKPGIVLFGKSDPRIFGYEENINLFKSEKYFRKNQFDFWFNETFDPQVFVVPEVVFDKIDYLIDKTRGRK